MVTHACWMFLEGLGGAHAWTNDVVRVTRYVGLDIARWDFAMRGIITGRDVVENVGIIYREFGARCLVRCLWVLAIGKRTTFLDVISQH